MSVGAELRAARRAYGLSQRDVGRMLGVSPSMVSKIERGRTPGERWAGAVESLSTRGVVTTPPARRAQRVRAPGGRTVPAPQAPPPLNRSGGRWRFGVQRGATRAGARSTTVDAPGRGVNRERARQEIVRDLGSFRGGPRSQGGRRVMFTVTTRNGRHYQIGSKGGYDPSRVRQRIAAEGGDPFAWLADTLQGMKYDVKAPDIVSVTLVYL